MTRAIQSEFIGWDYLILTASNPIQAKAYQHQLDLRSHLGFLKGFKNILVISDPQGIRIGSGGSTIVCLLEVINRESMDSKPFENKPSAWLSILGKLRILIIHAGGDSRRLPPYGPCGKIFVPAPGETDRALGSTLFDRLIPVYGGLPENKSSKGQIVITTGDVLLDFNPEEVSFENKGIIGLGCYSDPFESKNHGVFCPDENGQVRLFLQKPDVAEQKAQGAINRYGQSILDIGVMSLDANSAVQLLRICEIEQDKKGNLTWTGPMADLIVESGINFYCEICCAMGKDTSLPHLKKASSTKGSKISETLLNRIFNQMAKIPFFVQVLPRCGFLHFGTLKQLIESGSELLSKEFNATLSNKCLNINNDINQHGSIIGTRSWVEGCRIGATLSLSGENVAVGLDIDTPLSLLPKMCIDILPGKNHTGKKGWFFRCYGIYDQFNHSITTNPLFCNRSYDKWLLDINAEEDSIWPLKIAAPDRSLWNAQLFPFLDRNDDYKKWMWLFNPEHATENQKNEWKKTKKYSLEDIAILTDQQLFYLTRLQNRSRSFRRSTHRIFRKESEFSANELMILLEYSDAEECLDWIASILSTAYKNFGRNNSGSGIEKFELPRILHSMGTAILKLSDKQKRFVSTNLSKLLSMLSAPEKSWLQTLGFSLKKDQTLEDFGKFAINSAFQILSRIIVLSDRKDRKHPCNVLRSDEIVWGRAPARLDLGGGWSDTPPYSLENGGCVINAAVDLNGQPPIHTYARVIEEPIIRISSIDHSSQITINKIDELLDYREPTSQFGLAKAALVLSGFALQNSLWPNSVKNLEDMLTVFGGGIELTTLAAIPSGSGLGTSSIMGAVILAVINRLMGKQLTSRELFHGVLQLEQELTTGGGWQDQIGGVIDGVKVITTSPGMIPDPRIHYVPADLLDPKNNGGLTLLYYTGIRRLAKNILQYVVGKYLDRDRYAVSILRSIHSHPSYIAEALSSKDIKRFGEMIDLAWKFKKQIDPDSTTDTIEEILDRIKSYIYGATLLGAGGGGFLLLVCRSVTDAEKIRQYLEKHPPNNRARFFDYNVSTDGLVVTVC